MGRQVPVSPTTLKEMKAIAFKRKRNKNFHSELCFVWPLEKIFSTKYIALKGTFSMPCNIAYFFGINAITGTEGLNNLKMVL